MKQTKMVQVFNVDLPSFGNIISIMKSPRINQAILQGVKKITKRFSRLTCKNFLRAFFLFCEDLMRTFIFWRLMRIRKGLVKRIQYFTVMVCKNLNFYLI